PGGREAFGTHTPAESEPADTDDPAAEGGDFFAGVSASHDASDVETDVAGLAGRRDEPDATLEAATTAVNEPEPEPEPVREWAEPSPPDQKPSGSRWLRRRGAA